MRKRKPRQQHAMPPDDRTTVRAKVTPDEHEVIARFAKVKCGMTIDEFVRNAVDVQLQGIAKKSLATLASENSKRAKFVQGELFQ